MLKYLSLFTAYLMMQHAKTLFLFGVVALTLTGCREPVGTILVYEFDVPAGLPEPEMETWEKAIDRRVNAQRKAAELEVTEENQIRIAVYGERPQFLEHLDWRLSRRGTLEFRVLAHPRIDADLVQRAQEAASEQTGNVRSEEGQIVAKWVPIAEPSVFDRPDATVPFPDYTVTRTVGKQQQALVLMEGPTAMADQIKKVIYGGEDVGELTLRYMLDPPGSLALQELTENYVPSRQEELRHLGALLDAELWGANPIEKMHYDQGILPGTFSSERLRDLISVYHWNQNERVPTGGILPYPLRQVSAREVEGQSAN